MYGDDHHSLPIFCCASRTPGHVALINKPKSSSVQGFEHFWSDSTSAFPAFSDLTAWKTSAVMMWFPSQMAFLCVQFSGSDWFEKAFDFTISICQGHPHCLVDTIFIFDGSSIIRFFAMDTLDVLPEYFVSLLIMGFQLVS